MECRIRENSNADVDEIETEQALRDENNCKSKVEEIDSEEELLSDLEQMDLMSDDEDEPVDNQGNMVTIFICTYQAGFNFS